MALTSWKAFPFFTVSQVPVPADEDGAYIFEVRLHGPSRYRLTRTERYHMHSNLKPEPLSW